MVILAGKDQSWPRLATIKMSSTLQTKAPFGDGPEYQIDVVPGLIGLQFWRLLLASRQKICSSQPGLNHQERLLVVN
ncbi:hypothetical protein Mapa_013674 [Marchantia paleacea]|nr:hypothetical protein Mapa_013674 [Marchantia paleacea]